MNIDDTYWLYYAIQLAQKAETAGEVPVGAVLVKDNHMLGEGWNQPISSHDPTAHAEIVALRQAAKHIGNYRLTGTTLYVTLEPCSMCMGALLHARVDRLVFGASDPKDRVNHIIHSEGGVLEPECAIILRDFFKLRRKKLA